VAISDSARSALTFWGAIQSAVSQRATTAEVYSAIRDYAETDLGGHPLPTLAAVNELRSLAAQTRNASEALGNARDLSERYGIDSPISSQMMSLTVSSRDQQSISTLAQYQVRFETQFLTPSGVAASAWVTAKYGAAELPSSVGDLVDAVSSYALAFGYADLASFQGIGSISIAVV
jgi:hypothetical protein